MKKTILFSLVLMSMLLAACQGGNTGAPVYDPFIGGTEGIRMEFMEGQPPTEEGAILDNDQSAFSIGVQLTNIGEHDIEDGDFLEVGLKGVLPQQFGIGLADLTQELDGPLPGAKKNIDGTIIPGQFAVVAFEGLSYQPNAIGDIPKTFIVDLCYDYETISSAQVCIADDVTNALTDVEEKEICQVNGIKSVKSSGGPVQVTDVKQLPQGGSRISVILTIAHVGAGHVYKLGSPELCDDNLINTDRNKVDVRVSVPDTSSASVDCQSFDSDGPDAAVGEVTLWEGSPRTVTCTIEGNSGADIVYEDLLQVELSYMYGQTSSITTVIKDIGTANE